MFSYLYIMDTPRLQSLILVDFIWSVSAYVFNILHVFLLREERVLL